MLLHDPSFEDLAAEVRRVQSYPYEQQENLWYNTLALIHRYALAIPKLMWQMNNSTFLMDLAHDREFAAEARLPYNHIDEHWSDIRAGIALHYYEQLLTP